MTAVTERRAQETATGPLSAACRFCGVEAREEAIVLSPQTVVVPSVGSMVEGWVLAIPRRHVLALAELTLQEQQEFAAIVNEANRLVSAEYGTTVQFEHGPAAENKAAGCGVDHAHLHIVPFRGSLREEAKNHEFGPDLHWIQAPDLSALASAHASGLDYLYIRETDGMGWFSTAQSIPSQLFRQVIALRIGLRDWDWKCNPRSEVSSRTMRRLAK